MTNKPAANQIAVLSESQLSWETTDDNVTSLLAATNPSCRTMMHFVIYTLIGGTLCLLGLTGNTIAYVVLGGVEEMLPVAKFLLRSLAVADNFFLLVFFMNFSVLWLFLYTSATQQIDEAAWMTSTLVMYPLLFVAQTAAIWLNVLIGASRYLTVCWPLKSAVCCSSQATRIGN